MAEIDLARAARDAEVVWRRGHSLAMCADKQLSEGRPWAMSLASILAELQANGINTPPAIAAEVNARKIKTARGGRWHPATVRNLMMRHH